MSSLLANPTEERAFPAHPRLDRYFASATAEAARRRLTQCLLRGDGPALLLGAPGVGKTMLMNVLAGDLAGRLQVVRLASTQLCTRRALLQAVLHGLGAEFRDREEGELRLSLGDLLADPAKTGKGVALLIDEAQSLPTRLLEELRLLSNAAIDGTPRLRLVLAGSNALDEAFTAPELETFSQRLAARCYLEPLTREETGHYVRAHIAAAGADPDQVLTADAYEALALASDGLPRLINQVADRALVLAAEAGATTLDGKAISDAWSDLHQLAAPWQAPATASLAAAAAPTECSEEDGPAIEFGMLDEDDALQAEAEAVTRLGEQITGGHGVWDAGDKLLDLPVAKTPGKACSGGCGGGCGSKTADEVVVDTDQEETVSLAFPRLTDDEESLPEEDRKEPADEFELTQEAALSKAQSLIDQIEQTIADATPDPFAESFDEEEMVLDPYSDRERVIPAAPQVIGSTVTDLERAYGALISDGQDLPLEDPTELDEDDPLEANSVVEPAPVAAVAEPNDEVLVIEADEPAAEAPQACRQDYAELFANLRQG